MAAEADPGRSRRMQRTARQSRRADAPGKDGVSSGLTAAETHSITVNLALHPQRGGA